MRPEMVHSRRAELDSLKRMVHALSLRLADVADGAAAHHNTVS